MLHSGCKGRVESSQGVFAGSSSPPAGMSVYMWWNIRKWGLPSDQGFYFLVKLHSSQLTQCPHGVKMYEKQSISLISFSWVKEMVVVKAMDCALNFQNGTNRCHLTILEEPFHSQLLTAKMWLSLLLKNISTTSSQNWPISQHKSEGFQIFSWKEKVFETN